MNSCRNFRDFKPQTLNAKKLIFDDKSDINSNVLITNSNEKTVRSLIVPHNDDKIVNLDLASQIPERSKNALKCYYDKKKTVEAKVKKSNTIRYSKEFKLKMNTRSAN